MKTKINKKKIKKVLRIILLVFLFLYILTFVYHGFLKPLPQGISYEGSVYNVSEKDIDFLYDLTYLNNSANKQTQQEIFDKVFEIVDNSNNFIVLDFFLFNSDYSEQVKFKNLTDTLKDKLIEKKESNPDIKIIFITDEINNFYGSYTSDEIKELRNNGIEVVITDLTKLRDSNPTYSALWRVLFQWFGTSGDGWITHPLGNAEKKVTLRSYLKLLNTKANHRKVIVADSENGTISLVTSGNPHDASSRHSNIALLIKGDISKDIIETELAVAQFSGYKNTMIEYNPILNFNSGDISVQVLTEGKIRDNLIDDINSLEKGDSIDLAMFYLSDRKIINPILAAAERDVEIRIILDPNKDAFAREKNGIPNRQVAYELIKKSNGKIKIRWYDTKGEQFHTKMIIIKKGDKIIVYIGSANYTKRNIGDLNLETDIKLTASKEKNISKEIESYFDMLWNNENDNYTIDFSQYEDPSKMKYLLYRFQEASGFSSF